MLEVSFYILSEAYATGQDVFACKLAEKGFRLGTCSVIYTESEAHSKSMDDLLWTFRNTSFVPHQIYNGQSPVNDRQIFICTGFLPALESMTVINLAPLCPKEFERCARILEIVGSDDNAKQAGRQRYRHYQQAGAKLVTHNL